MLSPISPTVRILPAILIAILGLRQIGPHKRFAALFLVALLVLHALTQVHASQVAPAAQRSVKKSPTIFNQPFKILPPVNSLDAANAQLLPDTTDPRDVAKEHLTATLGFPENEWVIKNVVKTSTGVTAVYVRQLINGLEVVNGDINLNIQNGQVKSIGDSFYRGARPSQPDLAALSAAASSGLSSSSVQSPVDAFKSLAAFVGSPSPTTVHVEPSPTPTDQTGTSDDLPPTTNPALFQITSEIAKQPVPVRRAYVQDGNNLKLVYSFQLQQEDNWYHGHVNAVTGDVEAVNDWIANAIYPVIPVGVASPDAGPIVNVNENDVALTYASPQGWHKAGMLAFTDTRGNNVDKIPLTSDPAKNGRPDFRPFAPDFTKIAGQYTAGATVQLNYVLNSAHDPAYQHGFDEVSGNFQIENFGNGGFGDDAMKELVQHREGVINAFFSTPPDG
ncbi:hypothetical protein AMAG_16411 [Allomyces macrogynus ATCC 38327]|uniref:Extracellular metalloproteinase n=1 Tax=Allomyces macrogynus (strain ATCC 38327) TaxID=578462 RepID=A0A0L0TD96_ALLM3|nr:hypothetical protein AMAG_16411 [Allomyces macrogynus ATCC 38327]|eukprot:KNE72650.1 hypothetical protein AMAG_16411 [Allomyces macrogynus ATCC 38327]